MRCGSVVKAPCGACGTPVLQGHPLVWDAAHAHHHAQAEPVLLEVTRREDSTPDLFLCLGVPVGMGAVGPLCMRADDEYASELKFEAVFQQLRHWHAAHVCANVPQDWAATP